MKATRILSLAALMSLFCSAGILAQNKVSGKIVDASSQEPLAGANIIIQGTTEGASTDADGKFEIASTRPFPWSLEIRYVGYKGQTLAINASAANMRITLESEAILVSGIVVSASRQPEKVQEAPASISVLNERSFESSPNVDPVRSLVNVPGVQVQQQTASRYNIEMRSGAGLFGTSVFPILDYRSLIAPGTGAFQSDAAGISSLDLQRIEVVRGPGSALYGPGVTSGVVHFITKNPIDYPGTTAELIGGELSTAGGTIRHAGANANRTFGYKINASYKRGDEFTLDGSEGTRTAAGVFRSQISKFQTRIIQPNVTAQGHVDTKNIGGEVLLTKEELDPDGDGNVMQDFWKNYSVNTTLEFRPQDDLSLFASGGWTNASALFYNSQGEGLFQQNEFWGQARFQKGGLFAQAYYVDNDGGDKDNPTFLYQTGNRTPAARKQLEGQLQYNFHTPSFLNANWTAGADYRNNKTETFHLVYGRNEDDDDYTIYGGYLQGKLELNEKLDLVLAGRYDQFNFQDESAFSPRVAGVFKPSPNHTFRASFNRASGSNSALELNIDFPLAFIIPGSFDLWLHGNRDERTFNSPTLSWFNSLIPDLPVDKTTGRPLVNGLPLAVPHALLKAQVNAALIAGLSQNPNLTPLMPVITNVLNNLTPGGVTGTLGQGFNLFDGTPLGLVNAPQSEISFENTFEVGYKGIFNNKFGVTLDVYNRDANNFTRFTAISPVFRLSGYQSLGTDLGTAVGAKFTTDLVAALVANGMSQAQAQATANQIAPSVAGAYTQGGSALLTTPSPIFNNLSLQQVLGALPFHATVSTDQVPNDGVAHIGLGYRTFDNINYWGADLGLEYHYNHNLFFYGNLSWISESEFTPAVVGIGTKLPYFLNIPTSKFRIGANFAPAKGFRGNINFQHDDSFTADFGQYSGEVQARNTVDIGLGYKFGNGLSFDVAGTNIFDQNFRQFPNMPVIGRRILSKLTYTLGQR